jgi:hypothetical protein
MKVSSLRRPAPRIECAADDELADAARHGAAALNNHSLNNLGKTVSYYTAVCMVAFGVSLSCGTAGSAVDVRTIDLLASDTATDAPAADKTAETPAAKAASKDAAKDEEVKPDDEVAEAETADPLVQAGKLIRQGHAINDYLVEHYPSLRAPHRAVILANMMEESTFNPNAGVGSSFYGLCQWSRTRTKTLKAFAATQRRDYRDTFTQVDFVMNEMGIHRKDGSDESLPGFGHEEASGQQMLASATLHMANIAMLNYERYENSGKRRQKRRLNVAEDILPSLDTTPVAVRYADATQ